MESACVTDLSPVMALGGEGAREERFGPLTLVEDHELALASLTLRSGAEQPRPFGLDLPAPGHRVAGDDISAFWTAPGQWMIAGPGRAGDDFAAEVAARAPGSSVTEQTDGWVAIIIASSEGAAPILRLAERLINVDPDRIAPGCALRTGLDHMSVFAIRLGVERLAIIGMRSQAESLWHALWTTAERLAART